MPPPPGQQAPLAFSASRLSCPQPRPTPSVDRHVEACPNPPLFRLASSRSGKDNLPPAVIHIVHQQDDRGRQDHSGGLCHLFIEGGVLQIFPLQVIIRRCCRLFFQKWQQAQEKASDGFDFDPPLTVGVRSEAMESWAPIDRRDVTAQPGRWLGCLSGSSWDHPAWDKCGASGMSGRRGSGSCRSMIATGPEAEATEKDCPT